jgi:hypothetical protein
MYQYNGGREATEFVDFIEKVVLRARSAYVNAHASVVRRRSSTMKA